MYNFHTHTTYCDGSDVPELYVKQAVKEKMKILGFSAHAPVSFKNAWSLKNENTEAYFKQISDLKNKYADELLILNGLEIDFIPKVSENFKFLSEKFKLDYTIGSVHLIRIENSNDLWFIDGPETNYIKGLHTFFNNDIIKAVTAFYKQTQEMIRAQTPDIIGHMDKVKMYNKNRFFNENDYWYLQLVNETLDVIAAHNCIVEVNTRGVYTRKTDVFFPSVYILKKCKEKNISVMLNSDAHQPTQLNLKYKEAIGMLKEIGFTHLAIITQENRDYVGIDDYMR